jgi:glycosyltransferase involved in cell wall biosynthesis
VKIGIWCDYGFTLRPSDGIGVFVGQLLRGLAAQERPPDVALVFNGNDREVHAELLAYAQGLDTEIVVPPLSWLQGLRLSYQRLLSPRLRRVHALLRRLEKRGKTLLPRAVAGRTLVRLAERGSSRIVKSVALVVVLPIVAVDLGIALLYATLKHLGLLFPLWAQTSWRSLRASLLPGEYAGVFRLAREKGCDVWLLPYPGLPADPDLRAPLVVVVHDLVYVHHPDGFNAGESTELFALTRSLTSRAELTVCLSEAVRQNDLLGELRLPSAKTRVIPHAVPEDLGRSEPTPAATLRQRYGLPPRFFFYPGAFRPYKNHALAVRALALALREHGLDAGLVFTGSRPPPAVLEAVIADTGMRSRVHILGPVERADVAGLYRSATALVFPSLHEGFGFPPLEALASGCPVVCSDISVLREVLDPYAGAVTFVNPFSAEALARALADAVDAREVRAAALSDAKERVLARDWPAVAGEWLRACAQAVAARE